MAEDNGRKKRSVTEQETAEKREAAEPKRKIIGKCPRCGSDVAASSTGRYCENWDCTFAMWKDARYFEWKRTRFTDKIARELLESGRAFVRVLYSGR